MCHQTLIGRSLQAVLRCSLLFLLGLVGSFAHAQAPAEEQALTWTAGDPQLKWGPCPPFLPKGCAIAVLHGDPAKDNVDVFFKVPAKSTIPLHWHTSAERMVLVDTLRSSKAGKAIPSQPAWWGSTTRPTCWV